MMQYIVPIILIGIATLAFAYSPPSYNSLNLTLGTPFSTPPNYQSLNLTLGDSAQGTAGNDSCLCAGLNQEWVIDLNQHCIINNSCNIGTGKISFINTGNFTCNSTITAKNMTIAPNMRGYLWTNCRINLG